MQEAGTEEIILEARNVRFSYERNGEESLRGVDLKIRKGCRTALMGANGSGKSTFFLCCNGILRPTGGEMLFRGEPVKYRKKDLMRLRSKVGIVFQDPDSQLFSASVMQEISFGILNLGVPEQKACEEVRKIMDFLEITPFMDRPVHALSGGQKKQVAIADVLVMHPELLILDEPAAALDPRHTAMVYDMVDRMAGQGITVLMSTHDINYAFAWADEIILLSGGRVILQGPPEQVCRNREALGQAGLEEPVVLRLFDRLCGTGILDPGEGIPRTPEELEDRITSAGQKRKKENMV